MYLMFVNLPEEVITQRVTMIDGIFSVFFRAEYFDDESNNNGGPLVFLLEIEQCFLDNQNRLFGLLMNYHDW
jgi:hypothetical protein